VRREWTADSRQLTADQQPNEDYVANLKWHANLEEASPLARESERPILVQFEAPG
jgi:hypothetical protein